MMDLAPLRATAARLSMAATPAERKSIRADLNSLVEIAVKGGADKHAVAEAASIAYSTVNDVMRRATTGEAIVGALRAEDLSKAADLEDQRMAAVYAAEDARLAEILGRAYDPESHPKAPSLATRERNEAKDSLGREDQRCPLCSSPLRDNDLHEVGFWVHMLTSGEFAPVGLSTDDEALLAKNGYDQGWFVVGSGCARRVPATHKVKVTKRAA